MKPEEIIEGDEIIAIFQGGRKSFDKEDGEPFFVFDTPDGRTGCFLSELKYHSSWDWLMPVMAKINNTPEYYSVYIPRILSDMGIEINPLFIENTWGDIVEFIKWYNRNKKSV